MNKFFSSWTNGELRQQFKVTVNIDKLLEYITDNILHQIDTDKDISSVDMDEYYADDFTKLVITGSYDAYFKAHYVPATRWEPAEQEVDRPWIGDEGVGLLDSLPEAIRKLIDIDKVEEPDEGVKVLGDEW